MADKVSKDEQIGFHKGAISTLAKERQELVRMISIVDQLLAAHVKALKELGVDITQQAQPQGGDTQEKKDELDEKLEDLLK